MNFCFTDIRIFSNAVSTWIINTNSDGNRCLVGWVTTGPGLAEGPVDRSRKVGKEKQGNAPSVPRSDTPTIRTQLQARSV